MKTYTDEEIFELAIQYCAGYVHNCESDEYAIELYKRELYRKEQAIREIIYNRKNK